MTRNTSKLTRQIKTVPNHEGFPSYQRSLQEQFVQLLTTNTLGDTFYANSDDNVESTLYLHQQMIEKDPQFYAKALIYARTEGYTRLQPIVGLVYLSLDVQNHPLFKRVFGRIVLNLKDLGTFVELCKGGLLRQGMGRMIKDTVNQWLYWNADSYQILKNLQGGQGFGAGDIIKLTHPNPNDAVQPNAAFLYAYATGHKPEGEIPDPQIRSYELLKNNAKVLSNQEIIELIHSGALPQEVVTAHLGNRPGSVWAALGSRMPIFALLRNLATLQRHGAFEDRDFVQQVVNKLSNPMLIQSSKILPFRFYQAYAKLDGSIPVIIKSAVATAMELSIKNMPNLSGRVAVSPDVSPSMFYNAVSDRSTIQCVDIGAILAAAIVKGSKDTLLLPFGDEVVYSGINCVNPNDTLLTSAKEITKYRGNGTDLGQPIKYLLDHNEEVDVFVGITDEEEWSGAGFLHYWKQYTARYPKVRAYLLKVMPYTHAVVPEQQKNVSYIYGWSDSVLGFIDAQEKGQSGQLEAIRNIALDVE
jgi:60 kDa SS-A/Ro ribonucleoprotein